jgi:hypothetical protein
LRRQRARRPRLREECVARHQLARRFQPVPREAGLQRDDGGTFDADLNVAPVFRF